ncbi:hypothetical protein [Niveibacterium sp.]
MLQHTRHRRFTLGALLCGLNQLQRTAGERCRLTIDLADDTRWVE